MVPMHMDQKRPEDFFSLHFSQHNLKITIRVFTMNIVYIKNKLLNGKTSVTDLGEYFAFAGWIADRHLEDKLKTNRQVLTGGVCVHAVASLKALCHLSVQSGWVRGVAEQESLLVCKV